MKRNWKKRWNLFVPNLKKFFEEKAMNDYRKVAQWFGMVSFLHE